MIASHLPLLMTARDEKYLGMRIRVTANNGDPDYFQITHIEMRTEIDGDNQCNNGTVIFSNQYQAAAPDNYAYQAFTNYFNVRGHWITIKSASEYIGYVWSSPKKITEITIGAPTINRVLEAPKDFVIETTKDGTNWETWLSVTNYTSWFGNWGFNKFTKAGEIFYTEKPKSVVTFESQTAAENVAWFNPIAENVTYSNSGGRNGSYYAVFNGSNSRIFLQDPAYNSHPKFNYLSQLQRFTFAAWIKIDNLPTPSELQYPLLTKNSFYVTSNDDFPFDFMIDNSGYLRAGVVLSTNSGYIPDFVAVSTSTVPVGQWVFCAVSYRENGNLIVCLNSETTTTAMSGQMFSNSRSWSIGAYPVYGNSPYSARFKGKMDNFKFWHCALTDAELLALYQAG